MIYHLLKLYTSGLMASVGINGAPLLVDPTGVGLSGTMPANPWLKPKDNTLSILLTRPRSIPAATPRATQPPEETVAELFSVKPNSVMPEPDVMLAKYQRQANDPFPLPVVREIPFTVTALPPSNLWSDAARVEELSTTDQQQLRTLVQQFADALQRRNLEALSNLLDYKTKDCALANGQNPDEMRRTIRKLFANDMFTEPTFMVDGAQGAGLLFRLIAGNQVVWMFQNFGAPALVARSQAARYSFELFAAKIGGAWRIVR